MASFFCVSSFLLEGKRELLVSGLTFIVFWLAAPRIPAAGIMGVLHKANPQDACSPLFKDPDSQRSLLPPFVVVARGACNFDVKVRHAQEAGFGAVIVYNNVDDHELVTSMTPLTPVPKEAVFSICLCFSSFGFKYLAKAFKGTLSKCSSLVSQLLSRNCCADFHPVSLCVFL
jgi:hypothetical protein